MFNLIFLAIYAIAIRGIIASWDEFSSCEAPIQIAVLGMLSILAAHEFFQLIASSCGDHILVQSCVFIFYVAFGVACYYFPIQGIVWQIENLQHTPNCYPAEFPSWLIWILISLFLIIDLLSLCVVMAGVREVYRRQEENEIIRLTETTMFDLLRNRYLHTQPPPGLSDTELEGLRVHKFEQFPGLTESCAICTIEFHSGQNVIKLPGCNHTFHDPCIVEWLRKNPTCPNCRANIRDALNVSRSRSQGQVQPDDRYYALPVQD